MARENIDTSSLVLENRGYASADMVLGTHATSVGLKAGAVLAVDAGTAANKGKLMLVDKSNVSLNAPAYVLLVDFNGSATADTTIPALKLLAAGRVDASRLSFHTGTAYTDVHAAAKNNGIVFVPVEQLAAYDNA